MLASFDSFLGTAWFIMLVSCVSFCTGVYMADAVKRLLNK
tara:strand:+ start:9028 stop:9147 length:120 start_codon:yes stop_codon:yes gene_type:complete